VHWLSVLAFHWLGRRSADEISHDRVVLAAIALVACCYEVRLVVGAAFGECLDVIDDGAEMIEERRSVPTPAEIVIREGALVPALVSEPLEKSQRGGKDDRPMAPPTDPSVAPKYPHLELVGKGGSNSAGTRHTLMIPKPSGGMGARVRSRAHRPLLAITTPSPQAPRRVGAWEVLSP
jgi:hypothetical protein